MIKPHEMALALLCVGSVCGAAAEPTSVKIVETPALTVESDSLRLAVGANAHTLEFTDKSSGANYCAPNPGTALARVKKAGKFFAATTAALTDGRLVLEFAGAGVSATLRVVAAKHSVMVEVLSVSGDGVDRAARRADVRG